MAPTIFADCTETMIIAREEIFGPVMCVFVFDNEAEVLQRANDSDMGLAAGVITENLARAPRRGKVGRGHWKTVF